jgi:nucleotide-binding universal stress UspA family protein
VRGIADAPIGSRPDDSGKVKRTEMSIAHTRSPAAVWDRVICAIDASPLSVRAALAAAQLMPTAARFTLCTVVGSGEVDVATNQARTQEANAALARAQADLQPFHDAELQLRDGPPIGRLLDELLTERATMVTVGSRSNGRGGLGSLASAMLHDAPCAVLIAHTEFAGDEDVVVGFDGSGGARRALAVGRELAERRALKLRVLVATGDAHPPGPGWSRAELGPDVDLIEDPRTPVEALTDASSSAGLLILGSRHLPAALALSSVSEQAAQRATCPVLVVR